MARRATVLIVDDDSSIRQTLELIVRAAGFRTLTAEGGQEGLALCHRQSVDLVLLDVRLPDVSGLQVLTELRDRHPDVGVIMVSVVKEIAVAVEAMKLGALDYLIKDFAPSELTARITKWLDQLQAERELVWLREEVAAKGHKPMVIGRSAAMAALVEIARKVTKKPVTVLITGQSGTGKEVLARYVHERSDRASGPFVAVNIPAIPADLVESSLFGHERGAFTGATRQTFGKFELANGGTLFLDEIAELKVEVQAKLLRALQEREIERVGGTRPIPLDVRIVCATNRDLPRLVRQGLFRDDLYWRLKVVPLDLPPLRARSEDIPELAEHFLKRFAVRYGRPPQALSPEALGVLGRYAWPGNIRELENLMERLAVVCEASTIEVEDLPLDLAVAAGSPDGFGESTYAAAMASFEKGLLSRVMEHVGWNRRHAAQRLGIGYSTLKEKLAAYGLAPHGTDGDPET